MMRLKKGIEAEQRARDYLIAQGLQWLESNYRCRWGEIDLIMQEKNYLVFIEVRVRSSSAYGGALASVGYTKQQKLIKAAMTYLMVKKRLDKQPVRFDVVVFEGAELKMEWIKNAFDLG